MTRPAAASTAADAQILTTCLALAYREAQGHRHQRLEEARIGGFVRFDLGHHRNVVLARQQSSDAEPAVGGRPVRLNKQIASMIEITG